MRFFKRGETVDCKFIFVDASTGAPINVTSPTYRIVYYVGAAETVVIPDTTLPQVSARTGEYIANWLIPPTAVVDKTYFVIARGTHPTDGSTTISEDFFRVLDDTYFGNGGGSGLVARFTKP